MTDGFVRKVARLAVHAYGRDPSRPWLFSNASFDSALCAVFFMRGPLGGEKVRSILDHSPVVVRDVDSKCGCYYRMKPTLADRVWLWWRCM